MGDGFAPGIPRGPDPADPFGASMAFAAVEPAAVHARAAVKKPPGAGAGSGSRRSFPGVSAENRPRAPVVRGVGRA